MTGRKQTFAGREQNSCFGPKAVLPLPTLVLIIGTAHNMLNVHPPVHFDFSQP